MDEAVTFQYVFHFRNGTTQTFDIVLDDRLQLENFPADGEYPEWTELDNHKCPGCTLDSAEVRYCPAAAGIAELLEHFKDLSSTDRARVEVHTKERTYVKEADLQEGLFSLMGVIMPASGCPALSFLRPMARFHLPFSSIDETVVRSVCFFLLRQYFSKGPKQAFDAYLDELNANYETLQVVNECLIKRIRPVERSGDVSKNAVVILMVLSQTMSMELKSHLRSLEYLFAELSNPLSSPAGLSRARIRKAR